ncbi:CRISPR-associated protein Cas2 [Methanosarcina sp. MTP4]|uniref:CRISPR-associated endonuclease Cas2 n=1 Tax=Methanosarcina sp. MTP4 TaxID=1434100 RepID=UPI0006160A3F|nr:CRISPR-associated endonuclease Cas2 [Methanosarcina sp. MTP4]AKB26320.1 CRISPR-associated protein Cas2 [Methanosarcina sp. MTP4]
MLLWLIYDITDNSLRYRVCETCKDFGLFRVQKSVFFGELDADKTASILDKMEDILNDENKTEHDSVLILPVCRACLSKMLAAGRMFDAGLYTDRECVILG